MMRNQDDEEKIIIDKTWQQMRWDINIIDEKRKEEMRHDRWEEMWNKKTDQ